MLGNTVVWKPSEHAERCAAALAQAFAYAGLPASVLQVVTGEGAVSERVVSSTSSRANGRKVAVACAELEKRCALELGGKSVVIVIEDADLDPAADGIIRSAFGTSGQRGTSCSRVIVNRTVRTALTEKLVRRAR